MKVLCVMPSYWPAFKFGGPIYSVHYLNKVLAKKGIDISVYTTNVGLEGEVSLNNEVWLDGVKVTYFNFINFFEVLGPTGWQCSPSMSRALKNSMKHFDIVYIISIWNFPILAASHYCRKFNKPYIISPRGALDDYTFAVKAWKKKPYFNLISKRDIINSAGIHFTTEEEFNNWNRLFNIKCKEYIVPNGIILDDYVHFLSKNELKTKYPFLKNKKILLFLGRIHPKKGLDILIDAFHRLINTRKNVHLLIVGNDEENYKNILKKQIMNLGMEYSDLSVGENNVQNTDITFTGMLTGKNKLAAMSGSDIFVLTSYSENFGMAVVESMACGVPVIISNRVGVHKEIKKSNAGIIVEPNAKSIYIGLNKVLDNQAMANKIANNGKTMVMNYYDIQKVADNMIHVFDDILRKAK